MCAVTQSMYESYPYPPRRICVAECIRTHVMPTATTSADVEAPDTIQRYPVYRNPRFALSERERRTHVRKLNQWKLPQT
jgi:hypothetical protein